MARIAKAPPGPIKTKWGIAFRDYDECVEHIRQSNSLKAPPGGVALRLPYTVYERPSYSVVPSNAIWRDPARANIAAISPPHPNPGRGASATGHFRGHHAGYIPLRR